MRAALQAFQRPGNLSRSGCKLWWLASDYDLGDALTRKRADFRLGQPKFFRTGYWCIKYHPGFTTAKKSRIKVTSQLTLLINTCTETA